MSPVTAAAIGVYVKKTAGTQHVFKRQRDIWANNSVVCWNEDFGDG